MNTLDTYKFLYGIKTDRNGYGKNIMQKNMDCCYNPNCQNTDTTSLVRHELFRGSDRQKSKLFGLWIVVCPACHDLYHANEGKMHIEGQKAFEKYWGAYGLEFIKVFGRNYL